MPHYKQRKESNCLNCNAEVNGRYCSVCGQENIEPRENFWHIVAHFFNDITHFDGKFFTTTKRLLLRPGFLPMEYIKGKRASYLHPIRMYIFTSAIFFLAFFNISGLNNKIVDEEDFNKKINIIKKMSDIDSIKADISDSAIINAFNKQLKRYSQELSVYDSKSEANRRNNSNIIFLNISDLPDSINTINKYQEYQLSLPKQERDGWLKQSIIKKGIGVNNKYKFKPKEYFTILKEKFLHALPQMFFISLPFFALFLKLLYVRRKKYYYVDHAIFSIYHYIAIFLLLIIVLLLSKLSDLLSANWLSYLNAGLFIYMLYYLYKSMKVFYQQKALKTFFKFLLLIITSGIFTLFLTIGFLIITFFKT